jgi:AraC-like DNA-binding protein
VVDVINTPTIYQRAFDSAIARSDMFVYISDMTMIRSVPTPAWNVLVAGTARLEAWDIGHITVPCWRIYWAAAPGAWIDQRGLRWELGPDRLVVIAPYTRLQSGLATPTRHFWIHFSVSSPYNLVADWIGMQPLPPDIQHEMDLLSLDLETHAAAGAEAYGMRLSSLMARGMQAVPDALLVGGGRLTPRVAGVLRCMQTKPHLTIAELAASVHLTPRSLGRLFVEALDRSPRQVRDMLRLQRAELQLIYSQDSIEQVAEACGFHDRHHFSRQFSRIHGMGPATYRARASIA